MQAHHPPRKVCVLLIDRANYSRLRPTMQAIKDHPGLELQTLVSGTMVLERFQRPIDLVAADGFPVDDEVYMELEGSTPVTMAKSVGLAILEFTNVLQRLKPDVLVINGDRYEVLGAAIAAAYLNVCIFHLQGGEISGSIDESARHAITKFSHYHYPGTQRSANFLERMGERPETILGIGCPSSDIARTLDRTLTSEMINTRGSGVEIDVDKPFLLSLFHPTTTEFGAGAKQMEELLHALHEIQMPTLLLWPNIDAGADHVSKAIRRFRDQHSPTWLRTVINLPPETYLKVLSNAACAVGNSSSFIRDGSFFGTPVVLVGNRQAMREWGEHVTPTPPDKETIIKAVRRQVENGYYEPSTLYGDGHVGPRMAEHLASLELYTQKRLNYVFETSDADNRRRAA